VLYAIAYATPASFSQDRTITAWGWQAAVLSLAPLLLWVEHPLDNLDMAWLALLITPSNLAFIAAAILLWVRKRRAALACALLALASMIYGGFAVPEVQSQLVRTPAGHLGPGYYAWVIAGALMAWTAFSSRSAQ
jgi:hypothetical protein